MESEDNFNKVAEAVNEKYVAAVEDTLDQSKITDLKGFYDVYLQEQMSIDKEFASNLESTSSKTPPIKLELFADVFKYLDEFPPNLQKPKKLLPMRDRLNSTISKSSPSLNDLSLNQQVNTSTSSLNVVKCDDVPKPTDTYKTFQKFQKQLKQLTLDIKEQNVDKEYAQKLRQLHNFAQQLEKLLPKEKGVVSALTEDEGKMLEDLVNKMDDMNFIRENQDVFRLNNNSVANNSSRLESLVDILSHCLTAVNFFKI